MVLVFDDKNLKLTVRVELDEQYIPDEEIKGLKTRSEEVRDKYIKVMEEVKQLLLDCDKWNKKSIKE